MLLALSHAHTHFLVLPRERRSEQHREENLLGSADDERSLCQSVQLPVSKPTLLHTPPPLLLHRYGKLNPEQGHFNSKPGHIEFLCQQGKLASAVDALSSSQTSLSDDVYFSVLRACNRQKNSHLLQQLHEHLLQHRVDLTGQLGDYLVEMLAECGSIEEALQVLNHPAYCSVSRWNTIMSACNQSRRSEKTLELYSLMQETLVEPDCHTFASLVKACSKLRCLQEGLQVHAEACRKGLAWDVHVSNSLVSMYGKCGNILEAELVFGEMPERNFVSWTSMMLAYVDVNEGEKVLRLYRQMHEENLSPNEYACAIAIQACCILSETSKANSTLSEIVCLEIGLALHCDARRSGVVSNVFLCTKLVHMYGKLGRLTVAESVFISVPLLDSALCNAMLSTYLEHDFGEPVLQLYKHMMSQGVPLDQRASVVTVQACGVLAEKEEAITIEGRPVKAMTADLCQAIYADAQKSGFSSNVFLRTTLLGVYAKCGKVLEADMVFGDFDRPDIVTWAAMIAAYVEQDRGELALKLFRQMQEEGIGVSTKTFVVVIRACAMLGDGRTDMAKKALALEIGVALHADARKKRFDTNVFVGTVLVGLYGICGSTNKAENVFRALPERDSAAWNAMLNAYGDQGYGKRALQLYSMMLKEGISPNLTTYVVVLQACGTLVVKGTLDNGMLLELVLALHDDIRKRGFDSDVYISNTLITIYGNLGCLVEAENAFETLSHRPVVSWNAMFSTYVQLNKGDKALQLYGRMQDAGIAVDNVTLVCILQASGQTGNLRLCKQIHFSIVSAGYELDPCLSTTLIHAYANCGSMLDAQIAFDMICGHDVVPWNVCLAGYAGEGNYKASIEMLKQMQFAGAKPDAVTLTSVLSACSHGGLVSQGLEYFESLCKASDVHPDQRHFSSITDLLGRAGDLDTLDSILKKLPMHVDVSIWLSLLGACCVHGNVELGKQAFNHALHLKSEEANAFVMMSNLFSDFGLDESTDEDEVCE